MVAFSRSYRGGGGHLYSGLHMGVQVGLGVRKCCRCSKGTVLNVFLINLLG